MDKYGFTREFINQGGIDAIFSDGPLSDAHAFVKKIKEWGVYVTPGGQNPGIVEANEVRSAMLSAGCFERDGEVYLLKPDYMDIWASFCETHMGMDYAKSKR